jgi:hypothetical protein
MDQAPSTPESCKRTKLSAIDGVVKPKIILYGICVHELCFLICYDDGRLFTVNGTCCVVRCPPWFCGLVIFPLKL